MAYVNGVNLLPSTGEFTYGTAARQGRRAVETALLGINYYYHNDPSLETDYSVSMDQLQSLFPACTTVAIVCSWFGSSTDASTCKVYPSTTYINGTFKKWNGSSWISETWRCSSLTQNSFSALIPISTDANGHYTYGGTPSDQSIVECITDLRARGFRVVFYPFVLMDSAGKPWRGRITYSPDMSTAAASAVSSFLGPAIPANFTQDPLNGTVAYSGPASDYTFRRMILHYANLCALAGGVDVFLIGSELRGLEAIRGPAWTAAGTTDGSGNAIWDYPFVAGLIQLSDDVRSIFDAAGLHKDTTNYHNLISYSADWSDWMGYSHMGSTPPSPTGQWPHLDQLWAHSNIDLVAFDNYLPISDWTTRPSNTNLDTQLDVLNWTQPAPTTWPPGPSAMSGLGLTGTPTLYAKAYLKANIEGGERFNWFYFDGNNLGRGLDPYGTDLNISLPQGDRLTQSRNQFYPNQQILGQKQLRWWWSNKHYALYDNGDGSGESPKGLHTQWVTQSKPIVFTEYGFPACDRSTNQPNVFFDTKSTESATAYWSNWQPAQGGTGFLPKPDENLQLLALQAVYEYWFVDGHNAVSSAGMPMLEPAFCSVWNWDARPFPTFPQLSEVWGDAGNWQFGNWLSGKGPYLVPPVPDNLPESPVPLNFPSLPGLGWSVHKRPTFSTRVASHVSGREVRAPLYSQGLYEFELTIEGMDSSGAFPGLGAQSLQALMGLYIQCQGQYGTFLFTDPTDNTATGAPLGYGDGITTAFTLQRVLGSSTEAASWITAVNNVYLNGIAQPTGWTLATPNTLNFTNPPLGAPTLAQLLAETSATGVHSTNQSVASQVAGTSITFAVYAQALTRSACRLEIYNGVANQGCDFNLATGTKGMPSAGVTLASVNNVGGGWYQLLIVVPMATTAAPMVYIYTENPFGTTSYSGTSGAGIYISGANWAAGGGRAAFLPAFSTVTNTSVTSASLTLPPAVLITADFTYAFNCRFLDDQEDFEQIRSGLWQVQTLKFRSVKP